MPVKQFISHTRFNLWLGLTFSLSVLLMWWPALHTPFWGDDYVFFSAAHAVNASPAPWWSDFWPAIPPLFWRPLSQEAYWRLIDYLLGDNAYGVHWISLSLHMLSSVGVYLLALAIARACRWVSPQLTAMFAGAIYAGLPMHMLPVHWAAAANNSFLTLFTTLCLAAWIYSADARGLRRIMVLSSIPLSLALSLLCKESAALMVGLMLIIRLFTGQLQMRKGELVTLIICVVIVAIWLVLRAHLTRPVDKAYTLVLGENVVRNAFLFLAWMINVPREALRMAAGGDRIHALLWIAATVLPMLAAYIMAFWRSSLWCLRQWVAIVLFAGFAYIPYFFLAWNSYEYYAAIAAVLPIIALAHCCVGNSRILPIFAMIALSAWVAVVGTRQVDSPGLIGRARWAEAMLHDLSQRKVMPPLWVEVSDTHRFYAVGEAALAWRLGLPVNSIHVITQCPIDAGQCLQIDGNGHWQLHTTISKRASGA